MKYRVVSKLCTEPSKLVRDVDTEQEALVAYVEGLARMQSVNHPHVLLVALYERKDEEFFHLHLIHHNYAHKKEKAHA